jgi:8-oxo-dGTP pyrophosphatase MutT (NUDIX family)
MDKKKDGERGWRSGVSSNHKTKYSYGIACCRKNEKGIPEILLVQKRSTYSFVTFILCCGRIKDNRKIHELFCGMTYQEKMDIIQLDYESLWSRICGIPPVAPADKYEQKRIYLAELVHKMSVDNWYCGIEYSLDSWEAYMIRKLYFDTVFKADPKKLVRMMINSKSVNTLWDIPKGRRKTDDEKHFDVALREFTEETGANITHITPFLHCDPITYCYIDGKWKYVNMFFLAEADDNKWTPSIGFLSDNKMSEVQDAQWFSLNRLRALDPDSKYHQRLVNVVEMVLSRYKKIKKRS